jgi:endonuclease YncB( thermonuclease family)
MLKFIEGIRSIDRRILATLAAIPAFLCLCCCGVLFLTPANIEPTAAVAQNTAAGRSIVVEELIVTAESTHPAVTVEVSLDTPNSANTSRPSDTTEPTDIPQPTNTTRLTGTPTPLSPAGIETDPTAVPDGNLATVTYIVDGDTIDVALGGTTYRVRYIGMDTPERGDYFCSEATEANRAPVEGQQVILVKDVSETDRFGRLLRYVYLEDGTFVNAELVRQGYAVIATFPPDVRHQELFLELER